jgi:DNA repair protein RecN (Recombination protein N)
VLDHLRVQNLGVLSDAALEPSPGFTVITGETGAGKTLLLGGIRLLLGEKANPDLVGAAASFSRVDGLFTRGEEELGVTRVVPKHGRSRSHFEGAMVSAATLAESVGRFVEVVGQHDQLSLTRPAMVLELIDRALDDAGQDILKTYRQTWSRLQDLRETASRLGGDEMALRRELDLVRFQAREIESAALLPLEDETMDVEASRLRNMDEIRDHIITVMRILEEVVEQIGTVVARTRKASGLDPAVSALVGQSDGLAADAGDLATAVRNYSERLHFDPDELNDVESRLTAIGDLKRKYGRTLAEVVEFGMHATKRATELEDLLEAAGQLEQDMAATTAELRQRGAELTKARSRAIGRILATASTHLADLGLEKARLEAALQPAEPGVSGLDNVALLFASDDRLAPGPIESVASGGELSRLVLALRLAASNDMVETLVFDEVDSGIGGMTALAMGRKLAALSSLSQVVCVTHLPQIAAHADTHFVLDRVDGVASVSRVEGDDRIKEISRMLAGLPESDAGQRAAVELLEQATR